MGDNPFATNRSLFDSRVSNVHFLVLQKPDY
jgi:hypothetical protein